MDGSATCLQLHGGRLCSEAAQQMSRVSFQLEEYFLYHLPPLSTSHLATSLVSSRPLLKEINEQRHHVFPRQHFLLRL
jgi:hypothetical protein